MRRNGVSFSGIFYYSFTGPFIDFFTIFNMFLIVIGQEVSNFDSLIVVHELELAINRALYVFCAV